MTLISGAVLQSGAKGNGCRYLGQSCVENRLRHAPAPFPRALLAMKAQGGLLLLLAVCSLAQPFVIKRSFRDGSVSDYLTERICWWNEVCKEEFQTQFKCKCPTWSFCRSPGKYYNAFCSVAETGYIWTQPPATWALPMEGPSA